MSSRTNFDASKLPNNLPEVAKMTAQLVALKSTDPGSYEEEIETFIKAWIVDSCSFSLPNKKELFPFIQEIEVFPHRRCLRATIPSATTSFDSSTLPPSDLTFICHMDTVTDGDGWDSETPAFNPVYKDGLLYGRGSCDMKGGLACALLAFRDACQACKTQKTLPQKSLSVIFTVDEEANMRGVERVIDAGWVGEKGWVLDAEPTNNAIRGSHKGRTWFKITVTGITAHASTPWKGADAIAAMAIVINEIRTAVQSLPAHPELGSSTVTFGQIVGGYQPYVVPDKAELWVDMRLVPPTTTQAAEHIVQQAIKQAQTEICGTHASYDITGNRPSVVLPKDSELLAQLLSCAESCNTPAKIDIFTGYTDTAVIASTCRNTECMSYGPGELERAHKPNEYVPVEDLTRVYRVFKSLIQSTVCDF